MSSSSPSSAASTSDLSQSQATFYGQLKPLICLQTPPTPPTQINHHPHPHHNDQPSSDMFQIPGDNFNRNLNLNNNNNNTKPNTIIIQSTDRMVDQIDGNPDSSSPLSSSSSPVSTTITTSNGIITNKPLLSPSNPLPSLPGIINHHSSHVDLPIAQSQVQVEGEDGDDDDDDDDDDDEEEGAQYAAPMDDPFAEVENGWRRMSEASPRSSNLHQPALNHHQPLQSRSSLRNIHNQSSISSSFSEPISLSASVLPPAPSLQARYPSANWSARADTRNESVLDQLSGFSFTNPTPIANQSPDPENAPAGKIESVLKNNKNQNSRKLSLQPLSSNKNLLSSSPSDSAMNLGMRRSEHVNLFRPPSSSMASKTSFSAADLNPNRGRLSSFSTDLEPISGSPTSPSSAFSFSDSQQPPPPSTSSATNAPPRSSLSTPYWRLASQSSSSSSSFGSSSADGLLRRASSSSLASVGSVASNSTNGIKARRGLNKPLSLAVPNASRSNSLAPVIATPIHSKHQPQLGASCAMASSRSLPPSPRNACMDFENSRAQVIGMRANVSGGLSMKRRTSIPRLSLGPISSAQPKRLSMTRPGELVQLIGRNTETTSVANSPSRLCFDPVAADAGRHELLSSQGGVGGKGHIERPEELKEQYPYENGPREVLPDVYLGSEQNARDGPLLASMGFGLVINVAKEVECPWESNEGSTPSGTETARSPSGGRGGLLVRPTASTPNLKRSYEGKIRNGQKKHTPQVPTQGVNGLCDSSPSVKVRRFEADSKTGRPSLDYVKMAWSHDQDGLSEIFVSNSIFTLIDRAREEKKKTLIHCQCGVSRSATLMIGYCMREALKSQSASLTHQPKTGKMHEAYSFVKEKSPWAGPNMGLIYQLIEYEKLLMRQKRKGSMANDGLEEDEEEETDEEDEELRSGSNSNSEEYEERFNPSKDPEDSPEVVMMVIEENGMRTPTF